MDMMRISVEVPLRRGVVYGRASTSNDSQKTSLDFQTKMFYEYAKNNNIEIINVYSEVGSGTSITKRKEFKQMLADADEGKFDCILTKDVSRWSRDNLGFLDTIRHLNEIGVTVYFVNSGLNSEDDEMTLSILSAVSQKEALNTRAKTKSVRRHQVEHGAAPATVYGYDNPRGTGAYNIVINQKEAAVVRQIFEMYSSGIGAQNICRAINTAGIKTKRGTNFDLWNIRKILRSKIYIGILENNKQESLDKKVERVVVRKDKSEWLEHERPDLRIVEPELFYKCQELLDQKQRYYKGPDKAISGWNLPFTKVIRCAECGETYKRNRSGKYVYFKCNTHLMTDLATCENYTSIREDDLYNEVKVYMIALLRQREDIEGLVEQRLKEKLANNSNRTTEEDIKSELAKLKKQKARAMDLYIDGNDELKPKIDKLTRDIANLELQLNKLTYSTECNIEAQRKRIAGIFNTLEEFINCPDIRDLDGERFNRLFEGIEVYKDGHLRINLSLIERRKSINSLEVYQHSHLIVTV